MRYDEIGFGSVTHGQVDLQLIGWNEHGDFF